MSCSLHDLCRLLRSQHVNHVIFLPTEVGLEESDAVGHHVGIPGCDVLHRGLSVTYQWHSGDLFALTRLILVEDIPSVWLR